MNFSFVRRNFQNFMCMEICKESKSIFKWCWKDFFETIFNKNTIFKCNFIRKLEYA